MLMCAITPFELFSKYTKVVSTMCSTMLSDPKMGVAKRTQSVVWLSLCMFYKIRKRKTNLILVLNTFLHEKEGIT